MGLARSGVFDLDDRSGELRKQGLVVPIREQPLRLLLLPVAHRNGLVTRELIRRRSGRRRFDALRSVPRFRMLPARLRLPGTS